MSDPLKSKRSVWLHVHVPKAGGSTIRQLMNRTFGEGYYNSNSLLETKQYDCEDVSEIIRCHPWLRGFSDHKLSLDLPFHSEYASVQALCFVRNPVDRFVSRFFFHRNFEEVNCIAQKMTFRQFAEIELIEKFVHPQTNSQIYFLNGGQGNEQLELIQNAIVTGQTWLFPIERFDEACVCLEKQFADIFADLSYVKVNTSNRHDSIPETDLQFVAEQLAADTPLIDLANDQLDKCIHEHFESEQQFQTSLADFKDRCSRRFHNFRPLRGKDEAPIEASEIADDKSTNKPAHLNPSKSRQS